MYKKDSHLARAEQVLPGILTTHKI